MKRIYHFLVTRCKLRRLLCLLLFAFCFFSAQAQPYQSIFGKEKTKWIVTSGLVILEGNLWMDTISVIATEGEYQVLKLQSKWDSYNHLIGKIRTNETNSKLYLVEPDSTTELLIMDLDLEVGDSFLMKTDFEQTRTIYVDSVYLLNGKKHIQFDDIIGLTTQPGQCKRTFIEGMAPNWGFESQITHLIVCKYDDYIQTYSFENEHIKDCSFKNMNIDDRIREDNIIIYPNPAKDVIYIDNIENLDINFISIVNIQGQTIKQYETKINQIDVSNIDAGLYFIKISTSKGNIMQKIIINQ